MSDISRFLITTADERTWRFEEPLLFLGEWCRHHDRKAVWEKLPNAKVADPYGITSAQMDEDYATVCRIVDELIPIIARELNALHGTEYSERYWRIILSIWLHRYVCVILNRYKTLEKALTNYKISNTAVFDASSYHLATSDSGTFVWATNDDVWNNILYSEIAEYLPGHKMAIETVAYGGDHWFYLRQKKNKASNGLKKTIVYKLYNLYEKLAVKLVKGDDAFLISAYAGRKTEIMLNLALAQVPVFWRSPASEIVHPNPALRNDLMLQLVGSKPTGIEACFKGLLFKLMPTCFLEGYPKLAEIVTKLPWAKKPKFIFTSNNFDTDEVFKAWAGAKAETGTQYNTGQHGGIYGAFRYPISERYLLQMSNKFITWGWNSKLPTAIPGFIWNDIRVNRAKIENLTNLLIVGRTVMHHIQTWDIFYEIQNYQEDQNSFVESLASRIASNIVVRTYPGAERWRWCDRARWTDRFPGIAFDAHKNFVDSVRKARLVVFSLDSTGFLQLLQANYPVIGMWRRPFDWLRDDSKPYYNELIRAGILHVEPVSAATLINKIWEDIDGWWSDTTAQNARTAFCDRYAVKKRKPVRSLLRILGV